MRAILLAVAALVGAASCSAQVSLFPMHVVLPSYSQIARVTHVSGEVVLLVTISADGRVTDAKRVSGPPLLERSAIENVRQWTFDKPAAAPFTETLIYDFKVLDVVCGGGDSSPIVTFDFPARVRVSVCAYTVQPSQFEKNN